VKTYKFLHTVLADVPDPVAGNRKFRAGDLVTEGEILAGCLESCLRCGYLAEATEEEAAQLSVDVEAAPPAEPPAEPDSPAPKKHKART
jgi:hypothetical protein